MNIAIAQQNYHIGNFAANFNKIKTAIDLAAQQKADIVLFPELAVCGYPPRDFLEFDDFIHSCQKVIDDICVLTKSLDMAVVVGCPAVNPVVEGKDLFNAAYFIFEGKVQHIAHKTLLPTYDIFDEYRYFEPGQNFEIVEYKGKRIALTICEDIWNIANENPLYRVCPMDELAKKEPDFMLNLSASPFDFQHAEERINILKANVARYGLPIFYANMIGAQTEVIFDGGSLVLDDSGTVIAELDYFKEDVQVFDLEKLINSEKSTDQFQKKDKNDLIYRALVLGVQDYFQKLGFKKAILGLSGGIDSALTLVLAADALGAENVRAVLMPSQFSSDHSVADAVQLAKNLGCPYDIVPIQPMFESYTKALAEPFKDTVFNVTEENIQARIRGNILMAMSNKFGYILLNTSNKSESAVGYGTLYGDMCGGLSVIGDVYKTEVYALSNYLNRNDERIPQNTIDKPPSAELRPDQKDSDSLPDYELLDKILYHYIEGRKGPKELIQMGCDKALVMRVLRLVNLSEYKRYQTAPMLRISTKAFGVGRRMPIVAKYLA